MAGGGEPAEQLKRAPGTIVRDGCPLLAVSGHLARRLQGGICLDATADFAIYAFSLLAEKSSPAQAMNAWTTGDP